MAVPTEDPGIHTYKDGGYTIHAKPYPLFDGPMAGRTTESPGAAAFEAVKKQALGEGHPIFPHVRCDYSHDLDGATILTMFTYVRVATDEGTHYDTPVLNRWKMSSNGRAQDRAKELSNCLTHFLMSAYGMIMCGKPSPSVQTADGKELFTISSRPALTEPQRMLELLHPFQAESESRRKR